MEPLVSIITPCYNGENFLGRFLDSVLNQTYPNIELIIINDGSTDRTADIISSYKESFKSKGYDLIYIYQENAGQSAAINQGLKIFKGEFMTWLDSDDAIPSTAIATKVNFMKNNPELGLSICNVTFVDELSYQPILTKGRIPQVSEDLFADLIADINVVFCPGCYMVRSSYFKDAMQKRLCIEENREIGQNYQLLLPIISKYKWGYINESLYLYTFRNNSHSRTHHDYEYLRNKQHLLKEMLFRIIDENITDSQLNNYYHKILEVKISKDLLKLTSKYNLKNTDRETAKRQLKDLNAFNFDSWLLYKSAESSLLKWVYAKKRSIEYKLKNLTSYFIH